MPSRQICPSKKNQIMAIKKYPFLALLALCIFVCKTTKINGQTPDGQPIENNQSLFLIGKYSDGNVLLRWAPTSKEMWEQANQTGYHIERLTLPDNADELKNRRFERLTNAPLKPAPAAAWERATETDDAVASAYMVLFSELPKVPATDPFSQMKAQSDLRDNAYFIAMSSAELSAQAADLLGLRFADKKIDKGGRYLYRIFAAAPFPEGQLDTAMVYVSTEEEETTPQPVALEALSGEKTVYVKWNINLNRSNFFAYHIERSDSPNGRFSRLNQHPLIFMKNREIEGEQDDLYTFTDSVGLNYRPYYYRITGITPYGEVSLPSEVVMGMGKDLTPPLAPSIKQAETRGEKSAYLRWEKQTQEPDFKGFIVGRSIHPEGPFTSLHVGILPKTTQEFLDKNPDVNGRNFYAVTAIDTAGNESRSLSAYVLFADHTPPTPPIGLTGSVDSNGVVSLTWTPNREDDLLGYRVYWSNDQDHKFIMISSDMVREAAYTDTIQIHTLSKHVYYRIAAVDNGFGHSDFSEILELKRPDVVPPSPGILTDFKILENGIQFTWTPSTSSDLATQQLLRRQPDGDWALLQAFDKTATRYFDSPPANGIYEYALRSIDDDGQSSELSFPIGVNFVGKGETLPVEDLRAVYNKEKKALELRWRYPSSDRRFVIYRSVNDGGMMSYESVQGSAQFTDFGVAENATYSYAVRVVDDATGGESDLREIGGIIVK